MVLFVLKSSLYSQCTIMQPFDPTLSQLHADRPRPGAGVCVAHAVGWRLVLQCWRAGQGHVQPALHGEAKLCMVYIIF